MSATAADQEFLALLVHRGFLPRERAVAVLQAAGVAGFEAALAAETGWGDDKVAFLRRTRGLAEPEIPGYRVERRVGVGGTAEVFAARRLQDHRRVALKILMPGLAADAAAVARFLEEAKLLQRLDHPAIVRGHRVFKFVGTYVLEMDFVAGSTLLECHEAGREFDEDEALDIVLQVARALEAMRAAGVVHRDLKPGNLMIDAKGEVKLIDLGFAGAGMEGRASGDTTLGTPAYLAPEQAMGQDDLDARADIYSLGATLYHLVVGALPFEGESDEEVLRKQILAGLSGKALKGVRVSPRMHYFIEKMMAKDREVRYASAAELIADIEAMRDAGA
jgi:serine/threonine protein kinase